MTTNKPAQKSKTSPVPVPVGEVNPVSGDAGYASLVTGSAFPATFIVSSYLGGSTEPYEILKQLHKQADAVHQGDMAQVESMLMHQAVALQSMFVDLASRAKTAQSLQTVQCLTQLALRSQAGCRNTLQTLAEVKNPRQVAFVKQTNVAQTQQVNNGVRPSARRAADARRDDAGGNAQHSNPRKPRVDPGDHDQADAAATRGAVRHADVDPLLKDRRDFTGFFSNISTGFTGRPGSKAYEPWQAM